MSIIESNSNKRIAKNALFLYLRMLVMLMVSLFTARIVFKALGVDDFGLYNVVGSVIVFFTFINSGLTTATRRYITAELVTGDLKSQTNIFNIAILSHVIVSIIILVIAETIGLWAVNYFLNLPDSRMFAANVVYQASVATAVFNVMQAPYSAVITSHEKMSIYAYFSIFDVVFKLLVVLCLLWINGDKLIIYSIMMFVSSITNRFIYRLYCHRKFPECRFKRPYNRNILKDFFKFMGWSLAGQGSVVLTNQGVTVLVNMFFSVAANAAMGVSNQVTHLVSGFVTNFQTAFMPQITKQYVKGDYNEMTNLAIRSSRISSFLVLLFMIPIIFNVHDFLSLWLGDYPLYTVEFCSYTLFALLIDAMSAPLWMILGSDKNIKKYQLVISTIYLFNFLGGWLLFVHGYPPYSVIVLRVVINAVSTVARLLLVREKVISFPFASWFNNVWGGSIKVVIIPSLIMYVLTRNKIENKLLELFAFGSIALVLMAISIYLVGLTRNERGVINQKISSSFAKVISKK